MALGADEAEPSSPPWGMAGSWQAMLVLGALTLILGVIVSFHPTASLNVVAVLLGVLMILSGLFHLVRVFDADELHRVWDGIAGLLYIVIGDVLIRHLHLTRALIGLFIGITWIVQPLPARALETPPMSAARPWTIQVMPMNKPMSARVRCR